MRISDWSSDVCSSDLGVLLFCEHGLAPDASVRRWQDRLTPIWKPLAGGGHLNRDIPALLAEGGFAVTEFEADYLRGPRPMTYVYRGDRKSTRLNSSH